MTMSKMSALICITLAATVKATVPKLRFKDDTGSGSTCEVSMNGALLMSGCDIKIGSSTIGMEERTSNVEAKLNALLTKTPLKHHAFGSHTCVNGNVDTTTHQCVCNPGSDDDWSNVPYYGGGEYVSGATYEQCHTCNNRVCGDDQYRDGQCSTAAGDGFTCETCGKVSCEEGKKYRTGTCGTVKSGNAVVHKGSSYTCTSCKEHSDCPSNPPHYLYGTCGGTGAGLESDYTCAECDNESCDPGKYRKGTCSGTTNGWTCEDCDNISCDAGSYRVGTCTGTKNEYQCMTCDNISCPAGTRRVGTCSGENNGYKCVADTCRQAIHIENDDTNFAYNGEAWTSNDGTGYTSGNNFMSSDYGTDNDWQTLRIKMNGKTVDWTKKSEFASVNLKEMVTGNTKTEYFVSKGWAGASHSSPFGTSESGLMNGHEFRICHELSANYKFYDPSHHNFARLGYSMSQEYGCSHPGTAEGIGLLESEHGSKLASGRSQWVGETDYFLAADVYLCQKCADGEHLDINGNCIKCDGNQFWDDESKSCAKQCVHAIHIENDDANFAYDGAAWSSSADYQSGNNYLKDYMLGNWNTLRISMNGHTVDWTKTSSYEGYTLKQIATGNTKTEYFVSKGWAGASHSSPFGTSKSGLMNGHEYRICHELSGNYRFYDPNHHNFARLGYSMSQEYGCGHPGTSEGIGLMESQHGSKLASGRSQWVGETDYFLAADVQICQL